MVRAAGGRLNVSEGGSTARAGGHSGGGVVVAHGADYGGDGHDHMIARLRLLSPEAFFDVDKFVRGRERAWQRS